MRGILLSAALVIGTFSAFTTTPAAARDYPYCLQGAGFGVPGDCSYTSFEQCKATASGRLADCNINPRAAFAQDRGARYGNNGYERRGRAGRRAYRDDFDGGSGYGPFGPRY